MKWAYDTIMYTPRSVWTCLNKSIHVHWLTRNSRYALRAHTIRKTIFRCWNSSTLTCGPHTHPAWTMMAMNINVIAAMTMLCMCYSIPSFSIEAPPLSNSSNCCRHFTSSHYHFSYVSNERINTCGASMKFCFFFCIITMISLIFKRSWNLIHEAIAIVLKQVLMFRIYTRKIVPFLQFVLELVLTSRTLLRRRQCINRSDNSATDPDVKTSCPTHKTKRLNFGQIQRFYWKCVFH